MMFPSPALFLLCCVVLSPTVWAHGQNCQIQAESGEAIPYVNIYAATAGTGTVSDQSGAFSWTALRVAPLDTLVLSAIGYESLQIRREEATCPIQLRSRAYPLPTATVAAHPMSYAYKVRTGVYKRWSLGLTRGGITWKNSGESLGLEFGVLFEVPMTCRLESIRMDLLRTNRDTLLFEVNVYSTSDDGRPIAPLQRAPIYWEIVNDGGRHNAQLDIRDRDLLLTDDVIVTIEAISPGIRGASIWLPATIRRGISVARTNDGTWSYYTDAIALHGVLGCPVEP